MMCTYGSKSNKAWNFSRDNCYQRPAVRHSLKENMFGHEVGLAVENVYAKRVLSSRGYQNGSPGDFTPKHNRMVCRR